MCFIITISNEVTKVMFLRMSVILSIGGAIPACIAGGIPACLAAGGSAPGGGVCSRGVPAPGGGCVDPPESRRLLLRTVRILLECILVV